MFYFYSTELETGAFSFWAIDAYSKSFQSQDPAN